MKKKRTYLKDEKNKTKRLDHSKITHYLVAGRRHVSKWINIGDEKLERDNSGWKKR